MCSPHEERIVEAHNAFATSVVTFQVLDLGVLVVGETCEGVPVSPTPTVDPLLDVAHNHTTVVSRSGFAKKVTEVGPLQPRGVLEFIDHDVPEVRARTFKHERHLVAAHEFVKKQGGVGQHEGVAFAIDGAYLLVDGVQKTKRIEIFGTQFAGIDAD